MARIQWGTGFRGASGGSEGMDSLKDMWRGVGGGGLGQLLEMKGKESCVVVG